MEQENEETPPSGELISTVGALVGSVAGVWLKIRVLKTSQSNKVHTRAHMASNMLRTGEGSLANRTFVVTSHVLVVGGESV